jgi:hypothetical protein
MNNKQLSIGLVFLGVLLRLLPHAPNVAPIGAIALLAGSRLPKNYAFFIPLVAMFLSDLLLGFHPTMNYVYGSYLFIALCAMHFKQLSSFKMILSLSLFSSFLFFIITNFGVWISGDMYQKTFSGLVECYTLALPFFRNTIIGDLFYSLLFFKGFELLQRTSQQRFHAQHTVEITSTKLTV